MDNSEKSERGQKNPTRSNFDYDLLIILPVILLLGFGLVFVFSASAYLAEVYMGDIYYYLKRQLTFCFMGLFMMIIIKNIPCTVYAKFVYPLIALNFLFLILLFIPGIGHQVVGYHRWIRLGFLALQPTEVAKISLAIYMAYSMSKRFSQMRSFSEGLLPLLLVSTTIIVLILLQPDLGSATILSCWVLIILFLGGANILYLFSTIAISTPIVFWIIWQSHYRMKRWLAFLSPWDDPAGIGYQIIHSFLAVGSGGIFGVGLGLSKQKLLYLPEPHTDFILAVVAEELGFIGMAVIIFLFSILIIRGIGLAFEAPDIYHSFLAIGLSCMIGLEVLCNMGVVLGLLPTTGQALPFISYGGSSLIWNLMRIGILLNISASVGKLKKPAQWHMLSRSQSP